MAGGGIHRSPTAAASRPERLTRLSAGLESLAAADIPPQTQQRLQELATDAAEAAEEEQALQRKPPRRAAFERWAIDLASRLPQEGFPIQLAAPLWVGYTLIPPRSHPYAQLSMPVSWWGWYEIECEVRTPSGKTGHATKQGSQYMQGNRFLFSYPADFGDVPPLGPGEWEFTWSGPSPRSDLIARDYVQITDEDLDALRRTGSATAATVRRDYPSES